MAHLDTPETSLAQSRTRSTADAAELLGVLFVDIGDITDNNVALEGCKTKKITIRCEWQWQPP